MRKYGYLVAKLRRIDTDDSKKNLFNLCADAIEELSEELEALTTDEVVGCDEDGNGC